MASSPHVSTLVEMASDQCLAVLYYRKGVTAKSIRPRLVEPYTFAEGSQDLMIRCYQLEHDGDDSASGWRFFMSHKIHAVEPTKTRFKPRRKISLPTGEVRKTFSADPRWENEGRQHYRDLVADALADGALDSGERFDLEGIKQKYKLADQDVRFVHAAMYHRCLATVLEDGFVNDDEVDQIRFLHQALRSLGWAVGD